MVDRQYILKKMTEIRKSKTLDFISNIYSIPNHIVQYEENENAIAFLIDDKGVKRAYFSSNDKFSLHCLLKRFPSETGVEIIDYSLGNSIATALQESEYELFAKYLRLTNANLKETYNLHIPNRFKDVNCEKLFKFATEKDMIQIYKLLYSTFKPLTSHLQNMKELQDDIINQRVAVVENNQKIETLLTFKYQGKKLYMEHMINTGRSEYMHALYFYILNKAVNEDIKVVYTWVREDNFRALTFVDRYGLVPDGIKNYVFLRK